MVSFRSIVLALAGAAVAFAQTNGTTTNCNANCFNVPNGGYVVNAGQPVTLTWNPTTSGTVSLYLREGLPGSLSPGTPIVTGITNSGSYTWNVPSSIVRSSSSAIEIRSDSDSSVSNYTPPFNINSDNIAASTSGSATASVTVTNTVSSGSVMTTVTTTKASTTGSATTTNTAASAGLLTSSSRTSSGYAGRATAFAGLAGVVALGALAL